jgi:hypothetical protein
MGAPNNQPVRTAADVLQDLMRDPQHLITDEDAWQDRDGFHLLQATYETFGPSFPGRS